MDLSIHLERVPALEQPHAGGEHEKENHQDQQCAEQREEIVFRFFGHGGMASHFLYWARRGRGGVGIAPGRGSNATVSIPPF